MTDDRSPVLVDRPVAGLYKTRLVRGGPWVVVEIWRGFGTCPHTGAEIERGYEWRATVAGRPVSVNSVWPGCSGRPIDAAEAARLNGRRLDPDAPESNPRAPVDLGKMKPLF